MIKFILLIILGSAIAMADISLLPNISLSWPLVITPVILAFILNTRIKNGLPFIIGAGLIFDIYSSQRFGDWISILLFTYCLLFYLQKFFSEFSLSFLIFATVLIYLVVELTNWLLFPIALAWLHLVSVILIEIILAILIWSIFLKYFVQPKQISLLARNI